MKKPPRVDKETLARMADAGKSTKEAAEHFGVPFGSMGYWTKKHGVSFHSQASASLARAEAKAADQVVQQDPLNRLYKQVAEGRMMMRRLAYKERKLLEQISQIVDGGENNVAGESN